MSSAASMQQAKSELEPIPALAKSATQATQTYAGESRNEFPDLRPQASAQRQLQEAADRSARNGQFHACQQMAQHSARAMQFKTMSAMMNVSAVHAGMEGVEEEGRLQGGSIGRTEQKEAMAAEAEAPSNNAKLPASLKAGIESISGISMDHVKVHYNSSLPARLNAHAYAQGSEIHLGPGQEQHLPHEAWHVVQQAQGRVRPTMQMKSGVPVNDDAGLEAEADAMRARALQHGAVQPFSTKRPGSIQLRALTWRSPPSAPYSPVQRKPIEDPSRKAPFYIDDKIRKQSNASRRWQGPRCLSWGYECGAFSTPRL